MEEVLARARGVAEEAEVFRVSSEETQVQFEANRLKHLQTRESTTIALRVIKNGRVGYATTNQADNVATIVQNAVETADFGVQARFQMPSPTDYPQVEVLDTQVSQVPIEDMIALGEKLITPITSQTPGILCEAGVARGIVSVEIINSHGGKASYRKSFFSIGVEGTLVDGTDMLFVGDYDSSCHPLTETVTITDEVLRQLELAKNRAVLPSRAMPVIFTPHGVASALIAPLMAAFNGKTVLQGASPVGNRVGEQVFARNFSLWDDPTIPYRPTSRAFDDEGVLSQRIPLIQEGVVANFLYDLQTAGMAHTRSTGSASRGHGGQPSPAPSAFVITSGKASFAEMVKGIDEGLVIEQVMGAEQGNILGGDFSGNILLGYKVKSGRIEGRVKDTIVAGNVYQLLKEGVVLGSETRWVGALQTPPIYFPSLSVATKSD